MTSFFTSASVPLFDRLCAPSDNGIEPLDARGLQASLARELGELLGTRSRLPMQRFIDEAAHVLDYGLPDFSALSLRSSEDRLLLERAIARAIACFEPRLSHAQVSVERAEHAERALVRISAAVQIGRELRRVQFALPAGAAIGPPARDTG